MADRENEAIAKLSAGVGGLNAVAWDRLTDGDPFVSHAFLSALEKSGSVGQGTGWTPATILVEDDGRGIPESEREAIFARGARLDTEKPGTGLGLAIVRDVAEIYGGNVGLEESEDLGGLLVRLSLPSADATITAAP